MLQDRAATLELQLEQTQSALALCQREVSLKQSVVRTGVSLIILPLRAGIWSADFSGVV